MYDYYKLENYEEDYEDEEETTFLTPDIIGHPIHQDVEIGGTFLLPCIVDKLPDELYIIWRKDDAEKTIIAMGPTILNQYKDRVTVMVNNNGSTLTIDKAKPKDAGRYKCSVAMKSNPTGPVHMVRIRQTWVYSSTRIVMYSPEVEITNKNIHRALGDEAEIVCRVHASAKIVWSKDGQVLSSNKNVKIAHLGSRHTLTISQVKQEDFGKYTCQASNFLGSDQRILEIRGHAAPAEFKSNASGHSENSFLLEWTSMSYPPIEEFLLEISFSPSGSWRNLTVVPTKEGAYHFAGKQCLEDLQSASSYRARISAKNGEGWGSPGPIWNFTTKVPSPAKVTASATTTTTTTPTTTSTTTPTTTTTSPTTTTRRNNTVQGRSIDPEDKDEDSSSGLIWIIIVVVVMIVFVLLGGINHIIIPMFSNLEKDVKKKEEEEPTGALCCCWYA